MPIAGARWSANQGCLLFSLSRLRAATAFPFTMGIAGAFLFVVGAGVLPQLGYTAELKA
jgi:hypothetical protein